MSPRILRARMADRPAPLDATNGGPLYQQLRHQLFARIRRGEFAGGALLPSENQLCDEYGVSVTTARRALLELVKEGVMRRRMGVGTMVAPSVRQARLAVVSIGYVGHSWRRISFGMAELIVGVGELTWNRDASFSMSGLDEDRSDEYLRSLVEARSVDGVLLRTANDVREEHLDILEGAGMPYVVIKRELARRPVNCVVGDDVRGSRLATDHLLQQGHRRIGFVCAMPSLHFSQDRIIGYRQGVEAAGIGFDTGLVRLEGTFDEASGARAVRDLLHRPSRPTAVLVASDTMAIGGYQAVRDLGLAIPDDVAMVGYDDIGPVALLTPPLTTVRIAYYDFGRVAAQLLLDLIDGLAERPQRRVIEPELVVRGSSGPPPSDIRKLSRPAPQPAGAGAGGTHRGEACGGGRSPRRAARSGQERDRRQRRSAHPATRRGIEGRGAGGRRVHTRPPQGPGEGPGRDAARSRQHRRPAGAAACGLSCTGGHLTRRGAERGCGGRRCRGGRRGHDSRARRPPVGAGQSRPRPPGASRGQAL